AVRRSGETRCSTHSVAAGTSGRHRDRRPGRDRGAELDHADPARRSRYHRRNGQYRDHARGALMSEAKINPITVEVVRNAINAYADEMATALCKSAYNMMIYEVRDFCCGLIDREARMISQNKGGLPIFLADLGIAVKDGIDRYGLDGFAPGD